MIQIITEEKARIANRAIESNSASGNKDEAV